MSENASLSDVMDTVAKDMPEEKVDHLGPEPDAPVDKAAAVPDAWEPPGWSKRWKEPSRKALEALHSHPDARTHLDPLLSELEETYGYLGRRDNEYAQYRRQLDPIAEVIGPYVQQFQLAGMSPQQGLTQVLAFADSLSRNPDNTFPMLAQMYKPSNAGQVIKALSQAWGTDLGNVIQEEPYMDPAVKQLIGGLTERYQTIEQALYQQQQQAVQGQQAAVLQHIGAFENATDESGAAQHPHFRTVYDDMIHLINAGRVDRSDPQVLSKAYAMAVRLNPELSASIAEKSTLESAARQTAVAKQAQEASRNVSGKPNGRDTAPSTIEEAMRAAAKLVDRAS